MNPVSFAMYLEHAGYVSAWFGKHLNACPSRPPPGFNCTGCRWFVSDTMPALSLRQPACRPQSLARGTLRRICGQRT
eukprot:SAG25_NODE_1438_length_3023_cov_1.870041_9_plen_77_part_00